MADFFMSVNRGSDGSSGLRDVAHAGTASTAADAIELRVNQTGVTKMDVLDALRVFERWVLQGGLAGAGANLPAR